MILLKLFWMAIFVFSAGAIFSGYFKNSRILKFLAEFMALVALTFFLEDILGLFNIESLGSYIIGIILFVAFFLFYFVVKDNSENRDSIGFNFNLKIVLFIVSAIALFGLYFYSSKIYTSNSKEIVFNSIEEVSIKGYQLKEKFDSDIKKGAFEPTKEYLNRIDLKYSEFFRVGEVKMNSFNPDRELISLKFTLNIDSNQKKFLKLDKFPNLMENISIKVDLAKKLFSDGESKKIYITIGSKNGIVSFKYMIILDNLENSYLLRNSDISSNIIEELQKQKIVIIDDLMYQNQPFKVMKWKESKSYCSNLKFGSYSDWRLPTKKELKQLLTSEKNKNSRGDTFLIRKEFVENINGKYGSFWTLEERGSTGAWIVDFHDGSVFWNYETNYNYVLCVRE